MEKMEATGNGKRVRRKEREKERERNTTCRSTIRENFIYILQCTGWIKVLINSRTTSSRWILKIFFRTIYLLTIIRTCFYFTNFLIKLNSFFIFFLLFISSYMIHPVQVHTFYTSTETHTHTDITRLNFTPVKILKLITLNSLQSR